MYPKKNLLDCIELMKEMALLDVFVFLKIYPNTSEGEVEIMDLKTTVKYDDFFRVHSNMVIYFDDPEKLYSDLLNYVKELYY